MSQSVRLVISWLLVAVLLGYGVIETLITAAKIFTT
ncbi:MFS transporter small subunit [Kribbella sp. CWNU-51]